MVATDKGLRRHPANALRLCENNSIRSFSFSARGRTAPAMGHFVPLEENTMSKQHPAPSLEDIRNTHFDFLHPVELPAAPELGSGTDWELLERGSDVHIAFLEQALRDLRATLAELKAKRARRSK